MNTCPFSPCLGQSQIHWVGVIYCLGQSEMNTYFISPCLIGYQMGIRVGAQKHTPLARLSSTPAPFAGRLVGRMQYAPTLSEKDKVYSGRCFPLSRTKVDKYVFHFSMFNRLSDGYPGRGAKAYAPCAFIVYHFVLCRAFGRAYAIRPYPAGRKIGFQGLVWDYVWGKR